MNANTIDGEPTLLARWRDKTPVIMAAIRADHGIFAG